MKLRTWLSASVALTLVVAACGSDEGAADTTSAPATSAAAPSSAAQTTSTDSGSPSSTDAPAAASTEAGGSASTADLTALADAAHEEGEVVWYTAYNPELSQAAADAFQEEYGISVLVVRQPSADLNTRYASEAEAGAVAADVLWQPDTMFIDDAFEKGWLTELDDTEIPGLTAVDAELQGPAYVTVLLSPWGIAYNTDEVADPPTTWTDLLEETSYQGEIFAADPGNSVATASMYDFLLETYGEDFFATLRDHGLQVADSVTNAAQQVAAGEIAVAFPASVSSVAALQQSGAPIDVVLPDETVAWGMHASISTDAPHPEAARLFVEFLLSPEGQASLVKDAAVAVVDGVQGGIERPADVVPSDLARTAGRIDELVALLRG